MNTVAIVIVSVVFLLLLILLFMAALTIYDQDKAKKILGDCNSRLSNALRTKENQVDRLLIRIAELEGK